MFSKLLRNLMSKYKSSALFSGVPVTSMFSARSTSKPLAQGRGQQPCKELIIPGWLPAGKGRRSQFPTRYHSQQETASTSSPNNKVRCQPGQYPSPGLIPQILSQVTYLTSRSVPSKELWH